MSQLFDPDFNPRRAAEARDEAITRVENHASPDWRDAARGAVVVLARTRDRFTTDDVWRHLAATEIDVPHEPRALGAIMKSACKDGWITATNDWRMSERVECHRRPLRVWRSQLWQAGKAS